MKEHLLQIGPFPSFTQAQIDAQFHCHSLAQLGAHPDLAPRIRGIITRSNQRVPEDTVRTLPNLGIIATCGVGYDQIPIALARKRGIRVTHTPDVLNSAVAELAVGLILASLRRLPEADSFMRAGHWATQSFSLGESLSGKRVGIVGLGRIGREIAHRLAAFNATLAYFGRTDQHLDWPFEPELETLARDSDILVIAAPGGKATHHLINAEILRALGPHGHLINIARGSLVDEEALLSALANQELAGAALDVYQNEPAINPRFFELDNVVLAPHIGSATRQTRQAMGELTLRNLRSFFDDGSVITPVV
ncbi:Gluconate 2-dehydrogenase OS=Castellaniella defragrans OX=75697 GN=HNR28_002466 PE=3 SV=1 [Castellaniella defragrans]